ncbi:MFS transporter [Streptomyces sp. NBC_01180]|uniref:MFS transporter n=1 Tax=Streptomyces sp. NBC_01180 TaxID=2903763 RepID=UPI003865A7BB|nr:MFS transporter [Streptomyces sp. NBC_01180]
MPTCADRPETPRSDRSDRSDSRPGMLLALALAVLGYQLNATMLSPALPDVMRRLHTTSGLVGLSQTLFFLFAAVGQVTLARLSDYRGRKPMMLLGCFLVIAGDIACAAAPDIGVFLVGRVLQGFSAALFTLAFLTLDDTLSAKGFGRAAGIITAVNGGFAGVDAVFGGRLADTVGFRGIFLAGLVVSVGGTLAVYRTVPATPPTATGRMDWRGTSLLAVGLTGVLIGLAQGESWGWLSVPTGVCVLGGLASLVAFAPAGRGTGDAVIDTKLLVSRRAWPLLATTVLTLAGAFGALTLTVPLFTQDPQAGYGMSATHSALLFATPAQAIGVIGAPLAGILGPRIGWRRSVVLGSAGSLIAFVVAVSFMTRQWIFAAALAVLGITYNGLSITALNGLAVLSSPDDQKGALPGLNGACFGIGASLGTALASALITVAAGGGAHGSGRYEPALWASCGLLAMAMVTTVAIKAVPKDAAQADGGRVTVPAIHG